MEPTCPSASFAQVKAILDRLVAGREHMLLPLHGDQLGWATKTALANAVVHPFGTGEAFRLISPELVGVGKARETLLYKALTEGVGGFEQMPLNGPFATDADLKIICDWIDSGTPE